MDTNQAIAKLRHAYQQWHETRGKSAAAWIDLMADDVRIRSVADGAPGMEFSAPRDGKTAAHDYFAGLEAGWELMSFEVNDLLVDGDRVAMFGCGEYRHRGTGKQARSAIAHRWRFRDGLVIEFTEYYDTAKAFAAATPDPV